MKFFVPALLVASLALAAPLEQARPGSAWKKDVSLMERSGSESVAARSEHMAGGKAWTRDDDKEERGIQYVDTEVRSYDVHKTAEEERAFREEIAREVEIVILSKRGVIPKPPRSNMGFWNAMKRAMAASVYAGPDAF